jgi:hypothetical protein
MKMSHDLDYIYKFPADKYIVEFDFTNDIDIDSLASMTASCYNSNEVDKTASMLSSVGVTTPDGYFTIARGTPGETYNIKLVGTTNTYKKFTHYIKCEVFGSVTLNTKLGDINSNSYVTVKEANDYIRNKYGHDSRWDTLSIEGQKRVLIEAAKEIDTFSFVGEKYYDAQSMQFPRDEHDVVTGNCATPITINSFRNSSLKSTTYNKYPTDYWKYGTCHIKTGTPVREVRNIDKSHVTTGSITITENFTNKPSINTSFIIFSPMHAEVKNAQIEQALYLLENMHADTLQYYKDIGARRVSIGDVNVEFGEGDPSRISLAPVSKKLLSRFIRKQLRISRA